MNDNKLAQDHPCVIDMIRRHFLHDPSPADVPYNMTSSTDPNGEPSMGQVPIILRLLNNQVYRLAVHINSHLSYKNGCCFN